MTGRIYVTTIALWPQQVDKSHDGENRIFSINRLCSDSAKLTQRSF